MDDLRELPTAIATNPMRMRYKGLSAAVLTASVGIRPGSAKVEMLAGTLRQEVNESDRDFCARVTRSVEDTRNHLLASYSSVEVEASTTVVLG